MFRLSMGESPEEIQRQKVELEKRKAAIAREIYRKDQIQRELDAYEEGWQLGKTIAKAGFRVEVIYKMHAKQYPIEEIADLTNLSTEEVLHIINHSKTENK